MNERIEVIPWKDCGHFWTLDKPAMDFQYAHNLAIIGGKPDAKGKRAMLALSRLPHNIPANEPWLTAVRAAVDYAGNKGCTIVSSFGLTGWSYISWYAARQNYPLWLVLPPGRIFNLVENADNIRRQLSAHNSGISFIQPVIENTDGKKSRIPKAYQMQLRDRIAFHAAHIRFPIALRKGSFWIKLISDCAGIDNRFAVEYPKRHKLVWSALKHSGVDPELQIDKDLLIHWTRGTFGPWYGENISDYFEALTIADRGNPRDAYNTLKRIVETGILRGSGEIFKGNKPALSFSSRHPSKILQLIRFRSTLGHWNFEPYGVGFPKNILQQFGGRQVIYGQKEAYKNLPEDLKPFFQFAGRKTDNGLKNADWKAESEWRLIGDLDFNHFRGQMVVFVPFKHEAEELRKTLNCRVIALEKDRYDI